MDEESYNPNFSVKDMIKIINSGTHLVNPAVPYKRRTRVVEVNDDEYAYDVIEKPPTQEKEESSSSGDDEDDDDDDDDDHVDSSEGHEKLGRYINIPEIVDEMKSFMREEENYCRSLQDLVQNYVKTIETDKFDISDIFGCVDIISTYHNNTFLPALKSSKNVSRIADCFIMHKKLFNVYYDNYFKSKPNIIMVLQENKDVFQSTQTETNYKEYENILLNSIHDRVQIYQEFLATMKSLLGKNIDVGHFDRALVSIDNLTKYFCKKNENTRFVISELVQTERIYVERLQTIVETMIPTVEKLLKRMSQQASVVGTVPQIYSTQQDFYEALKKCLYDFNPNEVGECFLRHKTNFSLYVKDQEMKSNLDVIDECRSRLQEVGKSFDFYAPLNRLYKYKLLLQELKKSSEKGNLPSDKVEEALDMIVGIITKINGVAAINSIKDENIDINDQGELLLRDEFVMQNDYLKCDVMIFLFEKAVVITQAKTEGPKKNRRDAFIYVSHIVVKYLALNVCQELPTRFQIQFYGKYSRMTYVLQAKDKHTKDTWVRAIETMLMAQFKEVKQRNRISPNTTANTQNQNEK